MQATNLRRVCGAIVLTAGLAGALAYGQAGQQQGQAAGDEQDARQEASAEAITADELFPLEPREKLMRFTEGDARGETAALTLTEGEQDGRWVLELDGYNRVHLRRGSDGALLIERLDLLDEEQAAVYEPALPLIPASFQPGGPDLPLEFTGEAAIYDLETEEQTRTAEVSHRITEFTRARFNLPAGTVTGYYVEIDHVLNMDMASLSIRLETGYEPGQGVIYRRMKSTLEKLGMFGETSVRTAELADQQAAEGGETR